MAARRTWIVAILSALVFIAIAFAFTDWFIDTQAQALNPMGRTLAVLIAGVVLVLIVTELMRRFLMRDHDPNAVAGRTTPKRALSIIPFIRSVLMGVVILLTFLVALAEIGVDVGTMLASASVVAIIVGLGAQSLLRDILAGLFYIIDDAFRLGEYVAVGSMQGTVEKISLRSMQIRDSRGPLQTVPYGTILSVSNMSRDWVIVKLQFYLALDADVQAAKRIVKQVSAELMEDERFAPSLLSPLKFQGIQEVDLYGLRTRVKFTAVPGEQYTTHREVLLRLQKAFKENGLEFGRRSVTVSGTHVHAGAADDDEDVDGLSVDAAHHGPEDPGGGREDQGLSAIL